MGGILGALTKKFPDFQLNGDEAAGRCRCGVVSRIGSVLGVWNDQLVNKPLKIYLYGEHKGKCWKATVDVIAFAKYT
jgi:hypothetical protein